MVIIMIMVAVFMVGTGACFYLKWLFVRENLKYGAQLAGIANAGVIAMGNECALVLARVCADRENHRTQKTYEQQYNLYTFMFRFNVSYASFIYIAFLKSTLEEAGCLEKNCLNELKIQLTTIFLTGFIVQNGCKCRELSFRAYNWSLFTDEALKPLLMSKIRTLTAGVKAADEKGMERLERETRFEPYEEKEAMKDYAEASPHINKQNNIWYKCKSRWSSSTDLLRCLCQLSR